jgi:hypothetical protein
VSATKRVSSRLHTETTDPSDEVKSKSLALLSALASLPEQVLADGCSGKKELGSRGNGFPQNMFMSKKMNWQI